MRKRPHDYAGCTIWFCHDEYYGRGLCAKHYQNWLRTGSPLPKHSEDLIYALNVVDRFRLTMRELIRPDKVLQPLYRDDKVAKLQCRYCGAMLLVEEGGEMAHDSNCPVTVAGILLEMTQSEAPNEKFGYNGVYTWTNDDDVKETYHG